MLKDTASQYSWKSTFSLLLKPQVLTMLFLGFSAGIPFSLIFSSLSLWLNEAGISKATVTYFSWAGLAYSFKFLWAPLIDRIPLPVLTKTLGRRRAWILIAQIMVIVSILLMGSINPVTSENALTWMALGAVALGFSSATQDIVIDAYKVEAAETRLQGILSTTYFTGYRGAMIISGAGSLFLAEYLGSTKQSYLYDAWQQTYHIMASAMLIGVVTTLLIREPERTVKISSEYSSTQYMRFIGLFLVCVAVLVSTAITTSEFFATVKQPVGEFLGNKTLGNFVGTSGQFLLACATAVLCGFFLDKLGLVERKLVKENYYLPVKDFFSR
ncbi:MAG: hypothetical protein OQK04_10245, partial [Kangiellaceae bacterium]|nr:hypothetical protein [Kangiellaceae bacterium]